MKIGVPEKEREWLTGRICQIYGQTLSTLLTTGLKKKENELKTTFQTFLEIPNIQSHILTTMLAVKLNSST